MVDIMDCIDGRIEFLKERGYRFNFPLFVVEFVKINGQFPDKHSVWTFLIMFCGMVLGYECAMEGEELCERYPYISEINFCLPYE